MLAVCHLKMAQLSKSREELTIHGEFSSENGLHCASQFSESSMDSGGQ